MTEIKYKGKVYAVIGNIRDAAVNKTQFADYPEERLQFSVLNYNQGKVFQNHVHKHRPRVIEKTQECWVVMKGVVHAKIFAEDKKLIFTKILYSGDFIIQYRGGHGYTIMEDKTIVVECKLGDFVGVEEDKEKF